VQNLGRSKTSAIARLQLAWVEPGNILDSLMTIDPAPKGANPALSQIDLLPVLFAMTLLLLCAGGWMLLRIGFVLAQIERHSDETRLGRRFQKELRRRGLLGNPPLGVDD
jgi:hypothetical protein